MPTFWLGCSFFWYWATWVACIFWRLILCQLLCYYFLPFSGLSFHLASSFLHCAKAFKFNWAPLVYFCFSFHYSQVHHRGSCCDLWVLWFKSVDRWVLCHCTIWEAPTHIYIIILIIYMYLNHFAVYTWNWRNIVNQLYFNFN